MISHRIITAFALAASLAATAMQTAAAEDAPPRQKWSFAGPFGIYDQAQLQRGFKIYKEVCSTCHSLNRVAFHTLSDEGGPGFSAAQARGPSASAIATTILVCFIAFLPVHTTELHYNPGRADAAWMRRRGA